MEYRWEDLPRYGVVLVPPTSPDYEELLAAIRPWPSWGDPTDPAMIVRNESRSGIAGLAWSWKFEPETGRPSGVSVSTAGGATSVLAPFGLDAAARKLHGYWDVILPGSKRLIRGSRLIGDNSDVRPPEPDEAQTGRGLLSTRDSGRAPNGLRSVTLILDSVFFVDGGFAGPDMLRTFDRVTADVKARVEVAKIAQDGNARGLSPTWIFTQILSVTGAPDQRGLASQIAFMRQHGDPDRVIEVLMSWADTPLPNYRRL